MRSPLVALAAIIALVGTPHGSRSLGAPLSSPTTTEHAPVGAPLVLPTPTALKPADLPGLHNVVAFAPGVLSGAAPEGEQAFKSLQALGVKTIISVDGAQPDVDLAKKYGLRYVHLPIGYNGLSPERTLEIARAIRDLRGEDSAKNDAPIYIHCHHGKHRSAGAAGAAAVTLGLMTPEEATARMKVSGTAPTYTGLYKCAADAKPADAATLNSAPAEFPERWRTTGLVQTMVEVDEVFDHLKAIEKAGWIAPKDHPDLVPVAEAGRLADLFRNVATDEHVKLKPAEFSAWLNDDRVRSEALEAMLAKPVGSPDRAQNDAISAQFKQIADGCKQCHVKYRD